MVFVLLFFIVFGFIHCDCLQVWQDEKAIFYTALYHTLIHPNTLNDVNGEYPEIKRKKISKTLGTRYTVFSL